MVSGIISTIRSAVEFAGSATGIMMNAYANDMAYLRLMSYNSVVIEILCGLCGTIGVILTVPLQAFITVLIFGRKKK